MPDNRTSPSPVDLTGRRSLSVRQPPGVDLPLWIMSLDQETLGPHTHDFVELVYVNSGAGQHIHEGRRYPVFAGDAFVVAPGEDHGYVNERGLNITNVLFYPELIEPMRPALLKAAGFVRFFSIEPLFRSETSFRYKLHLSVSRQAEFRDLRLRLEKELSRRGPSWEAMATALFVQMLVMLGRCFEEMLASRQVRGEFDGKEHMVWAAIAFLEQNYARAVSVEEIARCAYVSASRLSHVFKEATGMSLLDYLTRIRVDRAAELLSTTDKSVSAIAYELGFHDPSYFARTFRKVMDETPREFREGRGRYEG